MSPYGGCLWPSAPENWPPEPRSTVWCCPLTIESRGVPWPGVSGAGLRATWLGWSTWKWISMMRWILWWCHCPSWNRKAVEGKVEWWWVATGGEVSEWRGGGFLLLILDGLRFIILDIGQLSEEDGVSPAAAQLSLRSFRFGCGSCEFGNRYARSDDRWGEGAVENQVGRHRGKRRRADAAQQRVEERREEQIQRVKQTRTQLQIWILSVGVARVDLIEHFHSVSFRVVVFLPK